MLGVIYVQCSRQHINDCDALYSWDSTGNISIKNQRLGMQAGNRFAAPAFVDHAGIGPYFIDLCSGCQYRFTRSGMARMGGHHLIGCQRVSQETHLNAAIAATSSFTE